MFILRVGTGSGSGQALDRPRPQKCLDLNLCPNPSPRAVGPKPGPYPSSLGPGPGFIGRPYPPKQNKLSNLPVNFFTYKSIILLSWQLIIRNKQKISTCVVYKHNIIFSIQSSAEMLVPCRQKLSKKWFHSKQHHARANDHHQNHPGGPHHIAKRQPLNLLNLFWTLLRRQQRRLEVGGDDSDWGRGEVTEYGGGERNTREDIGVLGEGRRGQ